MNLLYLNTFATDSCKQKYVQGFPLLCFGLYGGICSVILQTLIRACQPNGILFKSTNALAQEGRHKVPSTLLDSPNNCKFLCWWEACRPWSPYFRAIYHASTVSKFQICTASELQLKSATRFVGWGVWSWDEKTKVTWDCETTRVVWTLICWLQWQTFWSWRSQWLDPKSWQKVWMWCPPMDLTRRILQGPATESTETLWEFAYVRLQIKHSSA